MARKEQRDPYAPPPMHHDRSGAVLRIAILTLLLGGAIWGYTMFANQPQTPLEAETAQEQQLADAGGTTAAETLPEATSESLPPATPAPAAPARQPRRAAPAAAEPAPEPVPPPSTSSAPTTPTPIPPVDVPPAG
jgi:hypothetical protein